MSKTAMIAGASGLIGQSFLKKILATEIFNKVTIIVRKKVNIDHPKLDHIIINLDDLSKVEQKATHYFCFLGTTIKIAKTKEAFKKVDYDYVIEFAKLAKKNNSEQFHIVTALGSNPKSQIFYSKIKGQVEEHLKSMSLNHLFIYQPSILVGPREQIRGETRFAENLSIKLMQAIAPICIGRLKKYQPIHVDKIAQHIIKNINTQPQNKITITTSDQMNH